MNEISPQTPSPAPPLGARVARTPLQPQEIPRPDTETRLDQSFTTSDSLGKEDAEKSGPSAFSGTERPFFARLMGFTGIEILQLGLKNDIQSVDTFILGLAKERKWADTVDSYNTILEELRTNLGLHRNLEPLVLLERLSRGVTLLRLQTMHRRRDAEIQRSINKLNNQ